MISKGGTEFYWGPPGGFCDGLVQPLAIGLAGNTAPSTSEGTEAEAEGARNFPLTPEAKQGGDTEQSTLPWGWGLQPLPLCHCYFQAGGDAGTLPSSALSFNIGTSHSQITPTHNWPSPTHNPSPFYFPPQYQQSVTASLRNTGSEEQLEKGEGRRDRGLEGDRRRRRQVRPKQARGHHILR